MHRLQGLRHKQKGFDTLKLSLMHSILALKHILCSSIVRMFLSMVNVKCAFFDFDIQCIHKFHTS